VAQKEIPGNYQKTPSGPAIIKGDFLHPKDFDQTGNVSGLKSPSNLSPEPKFNQHLC